jgi:REP element-mobilizing transposase RayT
VVVLDLYKHANTSVYLLNHHFVFIPKRRQKVLVSAVKVRLKKLLLQKCTELKWDVLALEVMTDHVHLFVAADPNTVPNQVMHALKGYTSRICVRSSRTSTPRPPSGHGAILFLRRASLAARWLKGISPCKRRGTEC